jgi:hypothetical protein
MMVVSDGLVDIGGDLLELDEVNPAKTRKLFSGDFGILT